MIRLFAVFLLLELASRSFAQNTAAVSGAVQQPIRSEMTGAASSLLTMLSAGQRQQATFAFDNAERFVWYFVPHERKGLPLKQMTPFQQVAVLRLLKTGLSQRGYTKATGIMDLENALRVIENRPPNDTYRDPENYYITIFGDPNSGQPWSWRFEGHHLALQFVILTNADGSERVLAQTPMFFGSNPGVLRYDFLAADQRMGDWRLISLPQHNRQLMRPEADRAFQLLNALDPAQRKQTVLNPVAYPDIVTGNQRRASLERMDGLRFADMTESQRGMFLDLLRVYLTNYRVTLARQQMNKLEKAGLDELRFVWAGDLTPIVGKGKGWYYRIHGPTILIEYDNTQSNANHVHTVVRDLTNDFGEDMLEQHYRAVGHGKP